MPKAQVAKSDYQKLVTGIRKQIGQGFTRMQRSVDYHKVTTNWRVGRSIAKHILKDHASAARGDRLFERLAEDLDVSQRFLHRVVQFYRTYPHLKQLRILSWTHYIHLLTVSNSDLRKRLEQKILKDDLSVLDLRTLIYRRKGRLPFKADSRSLQDIRGVLYAYRLVKSDDFHGGTSNYLIDCGFHVYLDKPPSSRNKLNEQTIVKSTQTKDGYNLTNTTLKKEALYTYIGYLERVVDGDTVVVKIDCGFGIWSRQRLRLKAINTPELESPSGEQARRFVEKALSEVSFIVLKTYGSDKYGRYLADIFYQPREADPHRVAAEGIYLNQELLDAGLAEAV